MASDKEYLFYVMDLLRDVDNVSYKKMMGEYILYKDNIIFGGIYDNRFLIKQTEYSKRLGLKEEIPYTGAKIMFLVDIENSEEIKKIVVNLVKELK